MANKIYRKLVVGMCALLCASGPAHAFFCFSFGFGTNDHDRYRRLPPPGRYAPHPSAYLMGNYALSPTPGIQPGAYPYPAFPLPAPVPAATVFPGTNNDLSTQSK